MSRLDRLAAMMRVAERRCPEARIQSVATESGDVPTQVFNALGRRQAEAAPVAIVWVPGFASPALAEDPGPLWEVARADGCDLVRFCHPDLLHPRPTQTYAALVQEAATVITNLPNPHVVLAASSFGAGMTPHIVRQVEESMPGRILGVLGWGAALPETLIGLAQQQPGWEAFQRGDAAHVSIQTSLFRQAYTMTRCQFDDLARANTLPPDARIPGPVHFIHGFRDEIAPPAHSERVGQALSVAPQVTLFDGGHHAPPPDVIRGVASALIRAATGAGRGPKLV